MFSINRTKILGTIFTLTAGFGSVVAYASDYERKISLQEDVAQAELIILDIPVGKVVITGTSGNSLTAEVSATCHSDKDKDTCAKLLKELSLTKKTGRTTRLSLNPPTVKIFSDVNMEVKIGVPEHKKLKVHLDVGELHIEGTSACLSADVNIGEINVKLKEAQLGSAALDAKVGEAKLTTANGVTIEGDRSLLVGANLDWDEGNGDCDMEANVLVGEISLILN